MSASQNLEVKRFQATETAIYLALALALALALIGYCFRRINRRLS